MMIPIPIFQLWRPTWERSPILKELGQAADALLARRNRGPGQLPGYPTGTCILAVQKLEYVTANASCQEEEPRAFRMALYRRCLEEVQPLVRAGRWVRWIYLERAFALAAASGDLLAAALMLRCQIEELDALLKLQRQERTAAEVWKRERTRKIPTQDGCQMLRDYATFLLRRFLPWTGRPSPDELLASPPVREANAETPAELGQTYGLLNDYVHPNYGSHILTLFPERSAAGEVLLRAVAIIYRYFFCLDWSETGEAGTTSTPNSDPRPTREERRYFVTHELPRLGTKAEAWGYPADWTPVPLDGLVEQLRFEDERDESLSLSERAESTVGLGPLLDALFPGQRPSEMDDVVSFLWGRLGIGLPPTLVDCLFLVKARAAAEQLEQRCQELPPGECFPRTRPYDQWISFVRDCVVVVILANQVKIAGMRLAVLRMLNARNPFGAVICARSALEHWAVCRYVSERFARRRIEVEEAARAGRDTTVALDRIEAELAVFLTGSTHTGEVGNLWRQRLERSREKQYLNLRTAIEKVMPTRNEGGPGNFYAVFSRVLHGDAFTGGDLLGGVSGDNADLLLAKALSVLSLFADIRWLQSAFTPLQNTMLWLERPGGITGAASREELTRSLRRGTLPDKFKEGRNYFGRGTRDDPLRFREGLLYHEAFHKFCAEREIDTASRAIFDVKGSVVIDRVRTPDGQELFFANDMALLLPQSEPYGEQEP
jgi:hypothetical protein